jgi:DNA-binding IclR family transcriptional regulator
MASSPPPPSAGPSRDSGAGEIRSLATALDLLDCLADEPELGVAELGRRLGIAKSSAHRILKTLAARGYVRQVPETRTYRLGIRLHELGEIVASRSQLRDLALPLLESIRTQTGETVHLAVPEGGQMFYVERLESYHGLRFSSRVARMRPIHLTSSGKAVAAFNPSVADAAIAMGFIQRTPRTIRTMEQFVRCLAETRSRGYAFSIEEDEPGLASVAAPVLDRTGVARAAISVAGPVTRVGERIEQTARRVQAATRQLMSVESVWWSGTDFR